MFAHLKASTPLAIAAGILTAVWVEVGANFTFHWFTKGALGNGLSLPDTFHLVLPAAFISWALFFAAGGDNGALRKVASSCVIGTFGALILMFLTPHVAALPHFWSLSLLAGIIALTVVLGSVAGDWYYVPAIFASFASVLFWWIATGMDGWAAGGGGGANTLASLANPSTAGAGAFGGVISTPYVWVFVNSTVTLLIGCALGAASVRLAAVLTPRARDSIAGPVRP